MKASISAGLRRRSFVRSAALRSGAATIAAMRSSESAGASGAAHAATSSARSETKDEDLARVV
jgi:hypothetical protein